MGGLISRKVANPRNFSTANDLHLCDIRSSIMQVLKLGYQLIIMF